MPALIFPPSGGTLSPYLIGTWEVANGLETTIHLENPTSRLLPYKIVFFDSGGNPLACARRRVPHNGLDVVQCSQYVQPGVGVVKIIIYDGDKWETVQSGLVGYQKKTRNRWYFGWPFILFNRLYSETEAPLFQIPYEVLEDGELAIINALPCN